MSLWTRLFGRAPSAAPAATPPAPLRVEHLEDRTVPAVLDLTAAGASGAVNGALFDQFDGRTVGPHQLDTFTKLHARGRTAQGFNTNARPLQFQEDWSRHATHAIRVADLPTVTVNGVTYRELVLDVTQPRCSPHVSLDELRVYVSDSPSPGRYRASTGTLGGLTPRYDLDAGGDNWVKVNARLNGGNTRGDVTVYLPDAVLGGGRYLHLYSKFGTHSSAQCGTVRWAVGKAGAVGNPTPPPPAQTAGISGVVFHDFNRDGVRDAGEPAVAGRVVFLDANGNFQLDPGEATTTTDTNGVYRFEGLPGDASYDVRSFADDGGVTQPLVVFVAPGEFRSGVDIALTTGDPS
jgi:hypothetical protein